MEAGDHWIVYAVVDQGKVLQANGITAVHHRKSGGYY
jgi:flavin reductase (DIM6/NTAB) family NADH-FMN oxidoreductase RutF